MTMSYYPETVSHIRVKVKPDLDLRYYAIKIRIRTY